MTRSGSDHRPLVAQRATLLRAINEECSTTTDLVGSLDVSRSTVDRGVRELREATLIERTDEGYRTTIAGRLALSEHVRFTDRIDAIESDEDVFSELPMDAELDVSLIDGCRVCRSTQSDPERPDDRLAELVSGADRIHGFTPITTVRGVESHHEQAVEHDADIELVVPPSVVTRLLSVYSDQLEESLSTGSVQLRQTNSEFEYGCLLIEQGESEQAVVLACADDELRGLIRNDRPEAVEWAITTFERYKARSKPLRAAER